VGQTLDRGELAKLPDWAGRVSREHVSPLLFPAGRGEGGETSATCCTVPKVRYSITGSGPKESLPRGTNQVGEFLSIVGEEGEREEGQVY